MAFEELDTYKQEIQTAHKGGLSLGQIAKQLDDAHGLKVSTSTISRYLNRLKGDGGPPNKPVQDWAAVADIQSLVAENYAWMQGRTDEMQTIIERLQKSILDQNRRLLDLGQLIETQQQAPPVQQQGVAKSATASGKPIGALVKQIWGRAAIIISALWVILFLALLISGIVRFG